MANFVGLENLSATLERLRAAGGPLAVSQVQVSRGERLAGLTTFIPERPVRIVRSARPVASPP